jgi:hypothetical protein
MIVGETDAPAAVAGPSVHATCRGCYKPVIGGAAHLTWHRRKPPAGVIVRLFCEATSNVPTEPKQPPCECLPHSSKTDPVQGGLPEQLSGRGRASAAAVSAGHRLDCAS